MKLQELRYIIALAKTKHFGRAAEACFVSQPALSVAVQKLEDELSVDLFERYKNRVTITAVGQQIIEQARRVLVGVDDIKQIAKQSQDPLQGVLKLAAIFTVAPYVLPQLVVKAHKLAPKMPLEIQEDFTENLRVKLRNGDIDVALLAEPFTEPGIETLALFDEKFVVLMPKGHSLAKHDAIKPTMLVGEKLLLLGKGHCFRDNVLSACPQCYIESLQEKNGIQATTFEGASLETIRHMVASGLGITVLPETAAILPSYMRHSLVVKPLQAKQAKRRIVMAYRQGFPRVAALQCLQEALSRCDLSVSMIGQL